MNTIDLRIRPPHASLMGLEIFPQPSEERTKSFGWYAPLSKSIRQRSMPEFMAELDRAAIVHAVIWGREVTGRADVSTRTDDIVELIDRYPGRFSGLHGVGLPAPGTMPAVVEGVRRALDRPGIIGITVDAQTALPPQPYSDDARFYPAYEACEQAGGILALTMSRGNEIWDNIAYSSPESLDRIAGDFPKMDIIVSHACWPWVVQGCGVAFRRPNVFLLPDLYGLGMPGSLDWVQAANTFMSGQLVFGSAYPRLGVEEVASGYRDLPFRDKDILAKVMFGNAQSILARHGVKLG